MSASLPDRLRDRIAKDGPMPFRDFMAAALYDPDGGYYTKERHPTGLGPLSDFATSPTLHPFFAQAVMQEIRAFYRRVGSPAKFTVVEFGGGAGDMARDAIKWLDSVNDPLAKAIEWLHVEAGKALKTGDHRIKRVDAMPEVPVGAVVAHELLDAMPFDWLETDGAGNFFEVCVTHDGTRFVESLRPADATLLEAAPKEYAEEPKQRIVNYAHCPPWFQLVHRQLKDGTVLVMDYGERANRLWNPMHMDGTVRGFYDHGIVSDVLQEPGLVDITASVDFDLSRKWAEDAGLFLAAEESQEDFLVRHGILDALNAIQRNSLKGASEYLRLRQLLLPTGLGGAFRVQRFDRDP